MTAVSFATVHQHVHHMTNAGLICDWVELEVEVNYSYTQRLLVISAFILTGYYF